MIRSSKIAFRQRGAGPLLVLVHGYAGSVLHWDHMVPLLENNFRVVTPNLTHLYMGKEEISFSEQVDIFAHWLRQHFPNEKVHIAGISYGAALIWGLGLRHPQLLDNVILINPMPPSPSKAFAIPVIKQVLRLPLNMKTLYLILRTPLGRFFLKRISQVFRIERADFWDRIDDLHGRKLLFVCHTILRFSWLLKSESWDKWSQQIPQWSHPTLFLFDPQDSLFRKNTYTAFASQLKTQAQVELPGAGHLAIHTRANEISNLVVSFLSRTKAKTA